ncbi:MAG TPA: hypothetical protein VF384_12540 [Planctomycetota bacterium]
MNAFSLMLTLPTLLAATLAQADIARPNDKSAPAPAKAPFVFEPGPVELRVLIERCGSYLQRNILVDDSELAANREQNRKARPAPAAAQPAAEAPAGPFVELQMPVVTDRDGCEELLSSLLWTRGLTLVPLDEKKGVYEVLSMNGPRQREILLRAVHRTPDQVLARPSLRLFVTVVKELQHTNAQYAVNSLRPFFASNGSNQQILIIGNAGNTTSVLLNGPQDMVATALQLLQNADLPQPPDARPELTQRLDSLARQNEQLTQRIAALEAKSGKQGQGN